MFYIVGVTETCKRLAVCASERQASEYIGSLPHAEQGIYYIDACSEPVTLTELTSDDLPTRRTTDMDERLADWCLDRLRDAASEDAIYRDTPEGVLQREAARMEIEIHQLVSSFIDNTFDSKE